MVNGRSTACHGINLVLDVDQKVLKFLAFYAIVHSFYVYIIYIISINQSIYIYLSIYLFIYVYTYI